METNKKESYIESENKGIVDFEKLPLGQRLRKLGFKLIKNLAGELKCAEIQEKVLNEKLDELKKEIKIKYPDSIIIKEKNWGFDQKYINFKRKSGMFRDIFSKYTKSVKCVPKIVELENYIEGDIPISVYKKVEEAKKNGLKDFFVAYPVVYENPQVDPIVYAMLGEEMIWIAQWD